MILLIGQNLIKEQAKKKKRVKVLIDSKAAIERQSNEIQIIIEPK